MSRKSNLIYFRKLSVENVRCFGERQELDLTDDKGRLARWTLILGDNGAGKTTLLQCLAYMRPKFNPDENNDENKVQPELASEENHVLIALARSSSDAKVRLDASLSVGLPLARPRPRKPETISTTLAIERKDGDITDVDPGGHAPRYDEEPPLVLAYGAGRHPRAADSLRPPEADPVHSLFRVESELYDAEKICAIWNTLR